MSDAEPQSKRVVVVVLDGLRPDAIERFGLDHLAEIADCGAWSLDATTVSPSITVAAMTSLLTGVKPTTHGLQSDYVFVPRKRPGIVTLPEHLARHGVKSTAFMAEVPALFKGIATRVGRRLGFSSLNLAGKSASEVLNQACLSLAGQRRGLVVMHWPDADRAGHAHGWMSAQYGAACRQLDVELQTLSTVVCDDDTMCIALADHGGGGTNPRDHESEHPHDRTIPLLFWGAGVRRTQLRSASILDVAPTIAHALGIRVPQSFEGRVLREAFVMHSAAEPAAA